ncbi:hypothetical protein ASPWEDRAFT_49751 [Aspergillus wentii DTO 134E9]|uniref:DUF6314 domain-containing protein n=1 Tax=Aspergillus wentii DTO 134E9 TaxID=1073089 RepID=A0A1L9RYB3_ASPWE|nr:uncharacterized protein ASPWEDRAFT_49751 [Aspergillus wentii DTO 134E9]KAI9931428.1 hypothetical protein MW887_010003 [Aspergillus wentii]OJJ39902.1 hypothetical protein ASPWEDRAFT_49751 [Aspergillus wentii DTO 134E9]
MNPRLLSSIFSSLGSRSWALTRTLKSDNPMDIKGELRGMATFTPLRGNGNDNNDVVYREEGEMPSTVGMGMAGLRWTKKYIWRLGEKGNISVWFVKVGGEQDEADYLFHEFDFAGENKDKDTEDATNPVVTPPTPPLLSNSDRETTVLMARGNHLCIKDMYRTAYAFRIDPETGDVLSWSSRHMVKGPKKNQDIVNLYRLEG